MSAADPITRKRRRIFGLVATLALSLAALVLAADDSKYDAAAEAVKTFAAMNVKPGDCPQFGLSRYRNNVTAAKNIPTAWNVASGKNIKWTARLGTHTCASPVVANGKVFVGTNNAARYIKRLADANDYLGTMLCFDEQSGKFLWQHTTEMPPWRAAVRSAVVAYGDSSRTSLADVVANSCAVRSRIVATRRTRRQEDKETRRQGDKETRRQGDWERRRSIRSR
jgi:outer membrane protein assembly factor BamB